MNPEIVKAAWKAAQLEIDVPRQPFMCLSLVRRIVEWAHYGGQYRFYSDYLVSRTSFARARAKDGSIDLTPYASDIEASMKTLGLQIDLPMRQAGDLIFNHNAAKPYGHVGILLDQNTVIENVNPKFRPHSLTIWRSNGAPAFISLTPLTEFKHTLLARLEPVTKG